MIQKDAEPLTPPPKLSRAAAARIIDALTEADNLGNFKFLATAPVHAADASGSMFEIATVGEILMVCQQAVTGFEGGA